MSDDGSVYKVPYTTILEIQPHGNAERLEIAIVYGFQVVVSKDRYKVGDSVIYVPIDSVLPANVEAILFPPDSKIKLNKSRVRQIRIRGLASQGMIINPSELSSILSFDRLPLETDLKDFIGITKYEPPVPEFQGANFGVKKVRRDEHPQFHAYNGLNNIKWLPGMFKDGDQVFIQEKLHGTNARASKLPYRTNSLWRKFLSFIGLAPKTEDCYGSNRVQISLKPTYKGFYETDLYGEVFEKIDVFSKLKVGETVFGEIIGKGIQKNYEYGLEDHRFVLFDVKVLQEDGTQKWLRPYEVMNFALERGFEIVPILYAGPYNKELAYSLTKGNSVYSPNQKVREGIVIKRAEDYSIEGNKQALKWVSEDYLDDKTNTDFH